MKHFKLTFISCCLLFLLIGWFSRSLLITKNDEDGSITDGNKAKVIIPSGAFYEADIKVSEQLVLSYLKEHNQTIDNDHYVKFNHREDGRFYLVSYYQKLSGKQNEIGSFAVDVTTTRVYDMKEQPNYKEECNKCNDTPLQ